ncbi:MAG: hypothetical protein IPI67_28645 [Myxococcales bacterium]|nr:hypothetical protein [Myxococcales bacterium]
MNKKRFVAGVGGLAAALAAALAVFALFFARPMALRMAVERAAEHGVVLEPKQASLHFGSVTLTGSKFSLAGLPAIHGNIRELDVSLRWTQPVGLKLTGVDVEASGSAATLALGVSEWAKRYPQTLRMPTEAREASLVWRKATDAEPWLTLSGGTATRSGAMTQVSTEKSVLGVCPELDEGATSCPDLGKLGAAWTSDEAQVVIGFGVEDPNRAPVRFEIKHALAEPTADITLSPVALERLAGPFGVKLPVKNVTASGTVHLVMPKGLDGGAVTGTLDASLKGYIPPHPRELDGFVFGDTTTLSAKLRVDEARERADLSDVKVTAGAFKLAGTGSVARQDDHGALELELKGSLPCSALAGAAADSYLGRALGGLAGDLARQLIKGSVAIKVGISARSDDLEHAKVTKAVGVGCGLKPLKIGDLDIGEILGKLPPLPSSLPPLPSGLPALPKIEFKVDPPKPAPKPVAPKPDTPKSNSP